MFKILFHQVFIYPGLGLHTNEDSFRCCKLQTTFPLKKTMGSSIEPSAATVSKTVMCRFSTPVLRITQDFTPTRSMVFPGTRSKYTGVLSMFPIKARGNLPFFLSATSVGTISSCLQVQQEASVKVMFSLLV